MQPMVSATPGKNPSDTHVYIVMVTSQIDIVSSAVKCGRVINAAFGKLTFRHDCSIARKFAISS